MKRYVYVKGTRLALKQQVKQSKLLKHKRWLESCFNAGSLWNIWNVLYKTIQVDGDWFDEEYEKRFKTRLAPVAVCTFEKFFDWCLWLEKELQ